MIRLGLHLITPLDVEYHSTELPVIQASHVPLMAAIINFSQAVTTDTITELLDVMVPDERGRKIMLLRSDDVLGSSANDPDTWAHTLQYELFTKGMNALIESRPDVDWYYVVGNEPNNAGMTPETNAAMLRFALQWRAQHPIKGLSWVAGLPTTLDAVQTVMPATAGYECLGPHLYGDFNLADAADWQAILNLCLAQDRGIFITEAGINDPGTASDEKARRVLQWMSDHAMHERIVGLVVWCVGTWTKNPSYEVDQKAAAIYAARDMVKESTSVTIKQGVDRAGGIAPWEATGLKGLGFSWCGVYIGGPTNGGYGWSTKVVEDLATAAGWSFLPIYVGQNTDWTPVSKLNAAQGALDGTQASQLMQQFGWPPHKHLPCALDIEYNTNAEHLSQAVEYAVSWCNTVTAAGYLPVIYSHAFALNAYAAVAQNPTYSWLTSWLSTAKQDNPDLKHGLTTQFTDYAIQYTGGTWLQGQQTDFDLDACTDTFPLCPSPSQVGNVAQEESVATTVMFPETGHGIGGGFFQYWSHFGGLKIFGYPLTDEFTINDKDSSGKTVQRTVQVFERAVFEFHPGEAPQDWDVMLRRVGADVQPSIEALKAA